MEPKSYSSIFGNTEEEYKPSFLRDTTRLHLFNNYISEGQDTINERDDRYEGFYSKYYQEQIEDKYKQLGREDLYLATRTSIFENANFEIKNSLLSSTGTITARVFDAFRVNNLFDTQDEDAKFSRALVQEFSDFLVKPRSEREITGENLLPDIQQLQEIDQTLDTFINRGIVNAVSGSSQIRQDIEAFQQRTYNSASEINIVTNGGLRQSKRLLDNVTYTSRPGILPAIGIMHDATNSVSIDIYQYQNESVIDYHITNLLQRARDYAEGVKSGQNPQRFEYNLRVAYNKEAAFDSTGYNILGPNAIAIRKLERLKELYGEGGSVGYLLDINVSMADRRNHPKFMVNDYEAIVGSQNLTNPVGKSVYQQGNNFETLRVLHFKNDTYTSDSLQKALEDKLVNRADVDSETLMYMQARAVMNRIQKDPTQKFLSTGQQNIAGPMETMSLLSKTIKYVDSQEGRNNGAKISTILDQVFLLQHENSIYGGVVKGEMGKESDHSFSTNEAFIRNKSAAYRNKVQSPFMDMIIEGRADAVVDVRNYKEKIQDPIFSRLEASGLLTDHGYNLDNLIQRTGANTGTASERRSRLMPELDKYGFDESMATQILSMTSGNINTANVPRQHVKAFLAYENNKLLSGSMGSSNFGLYSLGYDDSVIDRALTNFEMNLVYADEKIRNQFEGINGKDNYLTKFESIFSLERNKETQELQDYASHFFSMVSNISSKRVGQLQYTNTNNRAEYERNVDRVRVAELYENLKALGMSTGVKDLIKVGMEYDSKGPIALQVKINNQLTYKFTALTSGSGEQPGFIYEINKSKVIGQSDFTNATSNTIRTGFSREGRNLSASPGQRLTMTPIETTMGLISSVALEVEQIKLIRAPLIEYQSKYALGMEGNYDFTTGAAKYLLHLSGNKGTSIQSVLETKRVQSADVILGALKQIEIRLRNPEQHAKNIINLTGIDAESTSRKESITKLSYLMQTYGKSGAGDREALLTGSGLNHGESIYGHLSTMLSSPEFADLRYDFIQAQDDPFYRQHLNELTKDISNRAYDPYLLRTQVNAYGSTQAMRQKPLYGVGRGRDQFGNAMTSASLDGAEGIMRLASTAIASSPFEFNGTDSLGKGDDIIFSQVAGGMGSRVRTEMDAVSYSKYKNVQPYYSHTKIGTTTSFDLLTDTGVGFNIKLSEQEAYRKSIRGVVGDTLADQIYNKITSTIKGDKGTRENLLLFNFDTSKKGSQIPQRIKNVKGSRPLSEVTEIYQDIIDSVHSNFTPIYKNRFQAGESVVRTTMALQSSYLEDLRAGVGLDKAHLITDEYSIGVEYGNKIRSTLSSDLARELETIRKQVEADFGYSTSSTQIGAELLRVRLLHLDTQASGTRGFTGSSKRTGHSVMLFQLSGAYSDYSFVNPYYGGKDGIKVGFVDRASPGHQGSKFADTTLIDGDGSGWSYDKHGLATTGQINTRDPETGDTYTYQFNESTQSYDRVRMVDKKKQYSLMNNLIDKVGKAPSLVDLKATSNAASFEGEVAREVLKEFRLLEGSPDSNEIKIEAVYNRIYAQTTRRLESQSGGLLKLNPINAYGSFFDNLINHFNNNLGGSFKDNPINLHQVRGIANPSNFKSYMYEHGATILTDNKLTSSLLANDPRKLAASLLMSFGTDRFGNSQLSNDVLSTLGKLAGSGQLGEYFKDQHTLTLLSESIKNAGGSRVSETKIAEQFIKGASLASVSNRDKGFANLQLRTLSYIGLDEINTVLKGGDSTEFIAKLTKLLSDPTGTVLKGEYLDIGKDRGRELSLLAGSLDLFAQMSSTKATNINVQNALLDNSSYYSLGTISGLTVAELDERRQELGYLVNALAAKSYVLGTNISASSSNSKVALSSKIQSFIENQHLAWTPFYADIDKFKSGGSVDQLRGFVSTIFGAMTGNLSGEFIKATENMPMLDILSPHVRGSVFKAQALGVQSSPLVSGKEFNQYKNSYEVFGLLHSLVNEDGFNLTVEKKRLLQTVIETYTKKSKGWDGTDVQHTFESLEDYFKNGGPSDLNSLKGLISQGYIQSNASLTQMYDDYRIYQGKEPGINPTEAKSSGMQRSVGKLGRFSMKIPMMEFSGDGTVKYYKDHYQEGFSFAGDDLKMVGESFGGFEPEIVKEQIKIWEGLHPGSRVSKFFDIIAAKQNRVGEEVVDNDTVKELIQFQESFIKLPYMLAKAAGEVVQKTLANKLGFDGGTTTPAAMFLGSTRASVLPEVLIDRQIGTNKAAKRRIRNLGLDTKGIQITKGYLQNTIDSINDYAENRLNNLKAEYPAALVQGVEDRFNLLFSSLNQLTSRVQNSSQIELKDIKAQIQEEVYRFETELTLSKWQTNRSSPMGNFMLGSDRTDNFSSKDADNYFKAMGLDIRLNPDEGETLNKTLHLRNVFSSHQTQGGDYDGDMSVNILIKSDELKAKVAGKQNLIKSLEEQKTALQVQVDSFRVAGKEKIATSIEKKIIDNDRRISNWRNDIQRDEATIKTIQSHQSYDTYRTEISKFIGNYSKVDYRFFIGRDNGGWADKDVDPSVMLTYMEQGRGLFGGMENVMFSEGDASQKHLFDTFSQLAKTEDKLNSSNWLDGFHAQNDAQSNIHKVLSADSNLSDEIRTGLIESIAYQRSTGLENEAATSKGISEYLAKLHAAKTGTETLHKFNAKGIMGTAMGEATFESMQKTLSQAGSVILGKTYNTMVGMLYTEAPSLAVSHAVLNDPDNKLEGIVRGVYGDRADDKLREMRSDAMATRSKAEQMGAFLQVTQQILRDSIKPKQGEQYLKDLDDALERFHTTDPKDQVEQDKARENLVRAFGPGSGLKALMQLESLTHDLHALNKQTVDDKTLFTQSELLKKYEIDSVKDEELSKRLGFNDQTGLFESEATKHLNETGNSKNIIIAAYKTKQDMVSLVSAFSFEKGANVGIEFDEGKAQFKVKRGGSIGNSVIDQFTKGLAYVDATTRGGWEGLVKGVEAYINDRGSLLTEEQAAYFDHIKDLGFKENTTDGQNYGWSKLTQEEKLYQAHVYLETKGQLTPTAGAFGEGLIKNARFNESRTFRYSNKEDRTQANSFDIAEDPLVVNALMGLTNGKVAPELVGQAVKTIVNTARTVKGQTHLTEADAMELIMQSGSLNDTPEGARLRNTFIEMGQHSSGKTSTEYLLEHTRSTAFGQMSESARVFTNSAAYQNFQPQGDEQTMINQFKEKGFSHEDASLLAKHTSTQYAKAIIDPDAEVHEFAKAAITNSTSQIARAPNKVGRIIGALGTNSDVKSNLLLPVLGLIGQAMATGNLDADMVQQAAGNSLSMLGYIRMSNIQNGWKETGIQGAANMVAGTGYKMRMAMEENEGDVGKALIQTTVRELTMNMVAHATTPIISKGIEKALGGTAHLDFDKFESSRNMFANVVGSMASTVLGMIAGNFTSKVAVQLTIPDSNIIEAGLRAVQDARTSYNSSDDEDNLDEVLGDNNTPVEYATQNSWASDLDYERSDLNNTHDLSNDYSYAFSSKEPDYYTYKFSSKETEDYNYRF